MTKLQIYAQGIYEEDSYKNCIPGTVLEEFRPTSHPSFYLVSQPAKLGISLPTRYQIIADSVGADLS